MKRCLIADPSEVVSKGRPAFRRSARLRGLRGRRARRPLLDMWRRKSPDIILLDWHLPGMTTVEFSSRRCASAVPQSGPFILFCTADNDPLEITRAFAAGIDAYMMKPFDRQSVVEKFTETGCAARSGPQTSPSHRAGIRTSRLLHHQRAVRSRAGRMHGRSLERERHHGSPLLDEISLAARRAPRKSAHCLSFRLKCADGECLAIEGPSGSGKTRLLSGHRRSRSCSGPCFSRTASSATR